MRSAVHGLVDSRIGIEIHAELHAYRFQPGNQRITGEMLGAVETHML